MNRAQRIGLAMMLIAIYFAVVRFGTDNPRIELCYGAFAYLFLAFGTWKLVSGNEEES